MASSKPTVRPAIDTVPVNRAVGNGTICEAGSTSFSHDHDGNVYSGADVSAYERSHARSPAAPRSAAPSTCAPAAENHASPPGSGGAGPKRSTRAGPSNGNTAHQPWA